MSGITFNPDTSTQQTGSYNSSGTFDPFIKSTTLSTQLALKQDTLTFNFPLSKSVAVALFWCI